jgi:hypothetical protein
MTQTPKARKNKPFPTMASLNAPVRLGPRGAAVLTMAGRAESVSDTSRPEPLVSETDLLFCVCQRSPASAAGDSLAHKPV